MRHIFSRAGLTLLLVVLAVESTREGVAAWLSSVGTADTANKAEMLDSANPNPYVIRSAIASSSPQSDPAFVAGQLESATRISPSRASNWALLGDAYNSAGDTALADAAFQRAIRLFPRSPKINWMYANFLIRSGDSPQAFAPLKSAMDGNQDIVEGAFDLAWRAHLSPEKLLDTIPMRSSTLSAYLDYLVRTNRADAADEVWRRLQTISDRPDLGASFHYFDRLFYSHKVGSMIAAWSVLARDYPDQLPKPSGAVNLIMNGGFETPPSNGGFDWRIVPVEGARIFLDSTAHDGSRSLCVTFEGTRNVEFTQVVQYVAVKPSTTYHFSAWFRAEGITTDSGPRIAIYDAFDAKKLSVQTPIILGRFNWTEENLRFTTGPATTLLVVQLLRTPSHKIDNKISGTIWLDSVSLSADAPQLAVPK